MASDHLSSVRGPYKLRLAADVPKHHASRSTAYRMKKRTTDSTIFEERGDSEEDMQILPNKKDFFGEGTLTAEVHLNCDESPFRYNEYDSENNSDEFCYENYLADQPEDFDLIDFKDKTASKMCQESLEDINNDSDQCQESCASHENPLADDENPLADEETLSNKEHYSGEFMQCH